jgi:hypothetical protein
MRARKRPDGETAPAIPGLSSHDMKKRASSAIRSSIGVLGFDELRRFARAGWLRKKDPPLMITGILPPHDRQQKGEVAQNINK